jgi:hypothetical protein
VGFGVDEGCVCPERTVICIPAGGKESYTELFAESFTLMEISYIPGEVAVKLKFATFAPGIGTMFP